MPSIWLYNCVSFIGHQAKLPTRFGEGPYYLMYIIRPNNTKMYYEEKLRFQVTSLSLVSGEIAFIHLILIIALFVQVVHN